MKKEVRTALKAYESELEELITFSRFDEIQAACKGLALVQAVGEVRAFGKYAAAIAHRLKYLLLSSLVQRITEAAKDINDHLPKYAHFCNDEQCSKSLCERHLLKVKLECVEKNTEHLRAANTLGRELYKEWGIVEPQDGEAKLIDGIEAASVISRQSRTSVGVIQAAKCVFQMCPTERSQTAAGILAMQLKDFPKSLHKLLEQEVSNSSRKRTAAAAGLP